MTCYVSRGTLNHTQLLVPSNKLLKHNHSVAQKYIWTNSNTNK